MNVIHVFSTVFAATAEAAPQGAPPANQLMQFLPMIAIIGVAMYFMILRPQKREQQQRQSLLDTLKKGDKIVTIGGIHGWVTEVDKAGKTVSVRVDTKTTLKINRSAVSTIETGEGGKDEQADKGKIESA